MDIELKDITDFVLNADSKALATSGTDYDVNVVPVSTIKVDNNKIILVDYFMKKTASNILNNYRVSLVVWSGAKGYQLKCIAVYVNGGPVFDRIRKETFKTFPERTVSGIITMIPLHIFDISVPTEIKDA